MLSPGCTPLWRWRSRYGRGALATALYWAVLLPAAHTLGHRDDHEHTPAGLLRHAFGVPHHHPGAGAADEPHHEHGGDHDHGHDDDGGLDQLSRRQPPPPHGHGSVLHLGAALHGRNAFVFTAELGPTTPAPVVSLVSQPRPPRPRPCAARAPPRRRAPEA